MLAFTHSGWRALLARCLAAMFAFAMAAAHAQGDAILIGQSVPLSGANRELGEEIREGALAYFRKVNDAGGIGGRRIELVSLDDANDTTRAAENAFSSTSTARTDVMSPRT